MQRDVLSARHFAYMVCFFIVGDSILLAPSFLVSSAKQDAWISALIGIGAGCAFAWIYSRLCRILPDKTFVQCCEQLLGKWLGKLVVLPYVVTLVIIASLILWDLGDFLVTFVLVETPAEVIIIIFILLIIASSRFGIGTLSRATDIFFPLFMCFFLLFIFSVTPQIQLQNILPILEKGIKPVIETTLPFVGYPYLELSLFLMIMPLVKEKEKLNGSFLIGVLLGGTVLALLTVMSILVLGVETTTNRIYPSYLLAQKINIAGFFTRIEIVVAVMWFVTIFYQLSITFYTLLLTTSQLFGMKDYNRLAFPVGGILITLPFIFAPTPGFLFSFEKFAYWPHTSITGLVVPLLLLGLAKLQKRRAKRPVA